LLGRLTALVTPLVLASAVLAGGLDQAERLYREGILLEAATLARSEGSADGLSLAARATLVDAAYLAAPEDQMALFERAAEDARQALALAPDLVDAHLQLALALGLIADRQDPITVHVNGHAAEGRELLERAKTLAPDDPWAHGLLGIWHLQVVRRATAPLAEALYDASEETGVELCARSKALAPGGLAMRYGCALSLLELDPERHAQAALADLKAIGRHPAADAADALVRVAAKRLVGELNLSSAD
jgi:hypothetical protein